MRVTRREFIGCAAAAAPLGWQLGRASAAIKAMPQRVVVDLGEHCSLAESIAGYAKVLGAATAWTHGSELERCDTLIAPAAVSIPPPVRDAVAACLERGGLVMLESGAAFASDRTFCAHRAVLRDEWHISALDPVSLWLDPPARGAPYVDFIWPFVAKIRDFSRVVPLESGAGKSIAYVNGLPVALRRTCGRGTLIVLGTPIGPALWAGDTEAKRWLLATVNQRRKR